MTLPACMTMVRSATRSACGLLWVTITHAMRRSRTMLSTRCSTARAETSSSADVGSSRRSASGAFASVRATETRCASPPDRLLTSRAWYPGRPTLFAAQLFATLLWSEVDIRRDGAGEQIRRLHDHTDASPQLSWWDRVIILAVEKHSAPRRLVEAIEQA
jgi:hypothetical protein